MKQYQTVEELMDSCVKYFEQQSYSPLRIDRYKLLWKSKLIPFMVQKSFLNYDPSVGEEYIRSKIAGSIVTPYERDIIRSINVLNEFQEKGTISKRHCKPIKRELSNYPLYIPQMRCFKSNHPYIERMLPVKETMP